MEYETIELTLREHVAHLTLNRPAAANTINLELARDLMYAAMQCDEDPTVRAVVLSGAGSMFCAGGDLKTFAAKGDRLPHYLKDVTTYLHAAVSRLTRMEAPVIAAVHGSAAGAGMSLACAADLVLAADTAKFTMAYTRAGLTPDGSSTYFLSRIVGLRRALELTLTSRVLTAAEALALGIVTRVVPAAQLLDETQALATALASGPTKALGASKRLLHAGWSGTLETQMELETRVIADIARSADAREGISAFVEKRPPKFAGR
ncbi:MAG: enoyl-CoA hydratase-related protein [Rhodospirillales bacterium]|nr:enoyl-CoA hydratase-related protein [Rhodospirillales bacterium]